MRVAGTAMYIVWIHGMKRMQARLKIIKKGCEMLGMEVKEVTAICIEAMKLYADELQLGVK